MKAFRFRLEKLLTIRQQQSKMAKNALAQARLRSRQAMAFLEAARQERTASAAALLDRRMHRMTARDWCLTAQWHESLVLREREAEAALQAALELEATRRAELAEAERRTKTLERLKERRAEEHRLAMEAAEQAEIDEMAQNVCREGGGLG